MIINIVRLVEIAKRPNVERVFACVLCRANVNSLDELGIHIENHKGALKSGFGSSLTEGTVIVFI